MARSWWMHLLYLLPVRRELLHSPDISASVSTLFDQLYMILVLLGDALGAIIQSRSKRHAALLEGKPKRSLESSEGLGVSLACLVRSGVLTMPMPSCQVQARSITLLGLSSRSCTCVIFFVGLAVKSRPRLVLLQEPLGKEGCPEGFGPAPPSQDRIFSPYATHGNLIAAWDVHEQGRQQPRIDSLVSSQAIRGVAIRDGFGRGAGTSPEFGEPFVRPSSGAAESGNPIEALLFTYRRLTR